MWFEQLVGDTERFALKIALDRDPSPRSGVAPDAQHSWDQLEIYAQGRCLTRHQVVRTSDAIAWYVVPLLAWFDRYAVSAGLSKTLSYPTCVPPALRARRAVVGTTRRTPPVAHACVSSSPSAPFSWVVPQLLVGAARLSVHRVGERTSSALAASSSRAARERRAPSGGVFN